MQHVLIHRRPPRPRRSSRRLRAGRAAGALVACLLLPAPYAARGAAPAEGAPPAESEAPRSSEPAVLQGLRLPDLNGTTVELASYLGKGPLVLDFWATWCKPCLAAFPQLEKLYADLHPRGLQLIGINEDGPRNAAKVKPFVQAHGLAFPVLLDLEGEARLRLNTMILPTTFLLDSSGKIVHTSFGYQAGEIDVLRREIEALLPDETQQ